MFGFEIGYWELYFSIYSSWSDEGGIEGLDFVGGHDDFYLGVGIESIELIEKL